jgi:hypothetical protein
MSNVDVDDSWVPPDSVNAQILSAVKQTNTALGLGSSANAAGAIAFAKAAQAAGLLAQDATDYTRNVMSLSTVAEGKALALMFASVAAGDEKKALQYAMIFVLAAIAPMAAGLSSAIAVAAEAEAVSILKTDIDS